MLRDLEKHNFGPRVGLAYRITDSFVIRSGYSLTWIEQAGITTPFTTPLFPFIQTVGQRSLDNIFPAFVLSAGPTVQVTQPNPDSGLGQGVFGTDRPNGSGYAQQWNLSLQKTLFSDLEHRSWLPRARRSRVGCARREPRTNLPADQLAQGSTLTQSVPNPYFGQIPSLRLSEDPPFPEINCCVPFLDSLR
jgi:hypothetical protein